MANTMVNPVTRAGRRYVIEFSVSMTAYVATMFISRWLLRGPWSGADRGWQYAIALLPMVPILLTFAVIVRYMLRLDELLRRVQVDSLALAGGATALIAATYGLVEGEYLPKLSAWWTFGTFMAAWAIAMFFVRRRYQ